MCQTRLLFRGLSEYNGHCAVDLEPESVVRRKTMPDRRQAAHMLRAREECFGGILSAAQEGVWVVDEGGRTLYANPAMAGILGVELGVLLDGAMWDFVDPDTAGTLRAALAQRMEGS